MTNIVHMICRSVVGVLGNFGGDIDRDNRLKDKVGPEDVQDFQ